MPHFFIRRNDIIGDICVIRGDDFHHLTRVRRVRTGRKISLVDEDGRKMLCEITDVGTHEIRVRILESEQPVETEEPARRPELTVYMALLKAKKFDFVVQKLVELGVTRIVPVITERTVPDYEEKERARLDRWNRIALEAAKQSLRAGIPVVEPIMNFYDVLERDASDIKIIANPGQGASFRSYLENNRGAESIALLVGPEGGFSGAETERAASLNWQNLRFGFTQLRAETAALALASVIIYEWSL